MMMRHRRLSRGRMHACSGFGLQTWVLRKEQVLLNTSHSLGCAYVAKWAGKCTGYLGVARAVQAHDAQDLLDAVVALLDRHALGQRQRRGEVQGLHCAHGGHEAVLLRHVGAVALELHPQRPPVHQHLQQHQEDFIAAPVKVSRLVRPGHAALQHDVMVSQSILLRHRP